ncbi:hypothetical protein [Streptomyces sp. NPDC059076]|uniref:hypothetical protein n=1 Tax=unclassified Streptomyces TaxID=2593676 RepID=UPI0036972BB3
MAIELTDELIALEKTAWEQIQAGEQTVDAAWAVQSAITAHAKATGKSRYEIEKALKQRVRHES